MWRGSKTNGRAAKFIGFLELIEAAYPAHTAIKLMLEGFFPSSSAPCCTTSGSHPKKRRLLMTGQTSPSPFNSGA
jgi:hypothetical protein